MTCAPISVARIQRIADHHAPRPLRERGDELVVGVLVDEDARAGVAHLALVLEDPPEAGLDRRLEVRVGEHDLRALPAELEGQLLQVRLAGGVDEPPGGADRAGEADLVDVGVARERLARGVAEAGHDVEDAVREAGLPGELRRA